MRDQIWLEQLLRTIWSEHFHDVPSTNPLEIRFGKKARNRLGSLSYDPKKQVAILRVTSLFQDPEVPDMIIKATIVHELCHYAHGFSSGLSRKYRHPHAGGVIRREFAERGLEELYVGQKRWLKAQWPRLVGKYYPDLNHSSVIRQKRRVFFRIS